MQKAVKKPAANTTQASAPAPAPAVKAPKVSPTNGIRDIATQTSPYWNVIMQQVRTVAQLYGFQSIRTSILEDEKTYLDFYKQQPEILEKILYAQTGVKTMAIRTSVLPSIMRHYVQNKVAETQSFSKWSYIGNTVHLNNKQAVQFDYQFGFEVFGVFNHLTEAQVISAVWDLTQRLGLAAEDLQVDINTSGDAIVQAAYQGVLKDYLKGKEFELCDECNAHLRGRVLNVLRCRKLDCQVLAAEAPAIVDFLDNAERKKFTDILEALDELGLPYQLNQLYIGPEGSTGTSVSIKYKKGNQTVVIGEAAHHESLMKNISGKPSPAFGFVGSLTALARAMELSEVEAKVDNYNEVFLVPLGELASKRSLRLFRDLIAENIRVHDHFGTIGVKNQLKLAEESKAPLALIMGQKEAMDEMVILRDVKSGMQEIFSYDKIIVEVKKRLER